MESMTLYEGLGQTSAIQSLAGARRSNMFLNSYYQNDWPGQKFHDHLGWVLFGLSENTGDEWVCINKGLKGVQKQGLRTVESVMDSKLSLSLEQTQCHFLFCLVAMKSMVEWLHSDTCGYHLYSYCVELKKICWVPAPSALSGSWAALRVTA